MSNRSLQWMWALGTALLVTVGGAVALLPVLGPAFFTLSVAALAGLAAAVAVFRRMAGGRERSGRPEHRTPSGR